MPPSREPKGNAELDGSGIRLELPRVVPARVLAELCPLVIQRITELGRLSRNARE